MQIQSWEEKVLRSVLQCTKGVTEKVDSMNRFFGDLRVGDGPRTFRALETISESPKVSIRSQSP